MNRTMAIDYGDKRVGIALSDLLNIIASPHCILENNEDLFFTLQNLMKEKKVGHLVIGLPLNMDGTTGFQAEKIKQFAEKLYKLTNIEYTLIDERRTSEEAIKVQATDMKKHTRHDHIDDIAASLILEQYLFIESRKNG